MTPRSFGVALATLIFASCSRTPNRQRVDFAHLSFDLPGDWTHHEASRRGVETTMSCAPSA